MELPVMDGRKERIMTQFIIFSIGFVMGAWMGVLITALIASSHDAEEREMRYWKHRKEDNDE